MTENNPFNTGDLQLLQFAKHKSVVASEIYIPQDKIFKKIFFIKKGEIQVSVDY